MPDSSNLGQVLAHFGPVMWVLGLLSVVALGLIVTKALHFGALGLGRWTQIEESLAAWRAGRRAEAVDRLNNSREPAASALLGAMQALQRGPASMELAREEATRHATRVLHQLRGGFRALDLIGQLSPLLGLLGTVLGMISAFQQLESAGARPDPALLSGGIWQALMTTAAGLVVAIPAIFALGWLEARVERFRQRLEDAMTRVFTQFESAEARQSRTDVTPERRVARAY